MVDVSDLVTTSAHPIVRHSVSPTSYDAAWVRGDAVVLRGPAHTLGLGPREQLVPLLHELAEVYVPQRLTLAAEAWTGVPQRWTYQPRGRWHWMWTTTEAPEPVVPCPEVSDPALVDAVLDAAMPESHARPGTPDIEAWLGVHDEGRLVGVGAVRRDPDGSGHLRGVCVLTSSAGRGLGTALSSALTRRAMAPAPHVATLGVYTDNAPALRVYDRLGYRVAHTFVSGPVEPQSRRWSTTAVAPSR